MGWVEAVDGQVGSAAPPLFSALMSARDLILKSSRSMDDAGFCLALWGDEGVWRGRDVVVVGVVAVAAGPGLGGERDAAAAAGRDNLFFTPPDLSCFVELVWFLGSCSGFGDLPFLLVLLSHCSLLVSVPLVASCFSSVPLSICANALAASPPFPDLILFPTRLDGSPCSTISSFPSFPERVLC